VNSIPNKKTVTAAMIKRLTFIISSPVCTSFKKNHIVFRYNFDSMGRMRIKTISKTS